MRTLRHQFEKWFVFRHRLCMCVYSWRWFVLLTGRAEAWYYLAFISGVNALLVSAIFTDVIILPYNVPYSSGIKFYFTFTTRDEMQRAEGGWWNTTASYSPYKNIQRERSESNRWRLRGTEPKHFPPSRTTPFVSWTGDYNFLLRRGGGKAVLFDRGHPALWRLSFL